MTRAIQFLAFAVLGIVGCASLTPGPASTPAPLTTNDSAAHLITRFETSLRQDGLLNALLSIDAWLHPEIPRSAALTEYGRILKICRDTRVSLFPSRKPSAHEVTDIIFRTLLGVGIEAESALSKPPGDWKTDSSIISATLLFKRGQCMTLAQLASCLLIDLGYPDIGLVCLPRKHVLLAVRENSSTTYYEATLFGAPQKLTQADRQAIERARNAGYHSGEILSESRQLTEYLANNLLRSLTRQDLRDMTVSMIRELRVKHQPCCLIYDATQLVSLSVAAWPTSPAAGEPIESILRRMRAAIPNESIGWTLELDYLDKLGNADGAIQLLSKYLEIAKEEKTLPERSLGREWWLRRLRSNASPYKLDTLEKVEEALSWFLQSYPDEASRTKDVSTGIIELKRLQQTLSR